MCNAWNHHPSCTCGWGGVGHKGRRDTVNTSTSYWPFGIPPIGNSIWSITVPNARCPVCGQAVFYYCNQFGSSVFFDELGPPWPKHPCTDNGTKYVPGIINKEKAEASVVKNPRWEMDEWGFFTVDLISDIDKFVIQMFLSNEQSGLKLSIYTAANLKDQHLSMREMLCDKAYAFAKKEASGSYILSIILKTNEIVQVPGFTFISEARDFGNSISALKSKRRK